MLRKLMRFLFSLSFFVFVCLSDFHPYNERADAFRTLNQTFFAEKDGMRIPCNDSHVEPRSLGKAEMESLALRDRSRLPKKLDQEVTRLHLKKSA